MSINFVDFFASAMQASGNAILSDDGSQVGYINGTTVWVNDPAFFTRIASVCDRYTLYTGIYTYARPAWGNTCAVED